MLDFSPNQFPIKTHGGLVFSKANHRIEFDGASGYEIADDSALNIGNQQFCVEVPKVIFSTTSGVQILCGQYDSSTSNQRSWRIRLNGSTLEFVYSTNGTGASGTITGGTLSHGVPYDVCAERGPSNTVRLYVDGAVVGSATVSGTFFNSTSPLSVGYNYGGSGKNEFFTGSMGGGIRLLIGDYRYAGAYVPPEPPWPTS